MTWYDFTCTYVDMKWKPASAKYRRAIAQALAAALPAMIEPTAGKPSSADIRRAVLECGYNTRLRPSAPDEVANLVEHELRRRAKQCTAKDDRLWI